MHVLQLGTFPPPEGGITRNLLAIREDLLKNGDECSVIAIVRSSKIVPEENVYHPSNPWELLKLLFKLKYDVLHLHIGGAIPLRVLALIAVCSFFGKGKTVFSLHSGGYAVETVDQANYFSLHGFVFRRFKRLIAVNSLMVKLFEKFGVEKEKIRLIYPFVHRSPKADVAVPQQLKDFAEKHKPFLLTVGLLETTYDLFMQIDVLEKVKEKFPQAGLMIIGSGSLENDLRKAIKEKSYAEDIFLTGDVNNEITLHLINDCDILLRTTLFDGDAISIREALHLETPVIATDNGMRPDGLDLIPIHDISALQNKIIEVSQRPKKAKTVKPDDRRNISAVIELYRELVSKSKFEK